MIINEKHEFIFQHNPRCAGTFLSRYFKGYVEECVDEKIVPHIFDSSVHVNPHVTFDNIIEDKYKNYKLLAGLRNPVDSYVSLYCDMYYKQEIMNYYKSNFTDDKFYNINFYNDDKRKVKAIKLDFETFLQKGTQSFSKERSMSYRFLERIKDYENLTLYKTENINSEIKDFCVDNRIPYTKVVFEGTIIRMSNRKRIKEVKSSLSESIKNKIMEYEYIISGYYK
jgi:hypothetical protein